MAERRRLRGVLRHLGCNDGSELKLLIVIIRETLLWSPQRLSITKSLSQYQPHVFGPGIKWHLINLSEGLADFRTSIFQIHRER